MVLFDISRVEIIKEQIAYYKVINLLTFVISNFHVIANLAKPIPQIYLEIYLLIWNDIIAMYFYLEKFVNPLCLVLSCNSWIYITYSATKSLISSTKLSTITNESARQWYNSLQSTKPSN
jgi:hypothetical protein